MSLVGPRPPIAYEVEKYDVWHRRRIMELKPGITGLWQVKGRSTTNFDEKVRLDLQYARTWSILAGCPASCLHAARDAQRQGRLLIARTEKAAEQAALRFVHERVPRALGDADTIFDVVH